MDQRSLGPLPKADRNSQLQQESITAFRAVLPSDRFLFRDERIEDYGVDGSVELLLNGAATNYRSQIQLKSTESLEPNSDGSYSVSVTVTSFNYLLQHPSPVFVLHVNGPNRLYLAWARDEERRNNIKSQTWMSQETVTIRFDEEISEATLQSLYERVFREGDFVRRSLTLIGNGQGTGLVSLTIDELSLAIESPAINALKIEANGIALITSGEVQQILKHIDMLPGDLITPKIALIKGFGLIKRGDYHGGKAAIASSRKGWSNFPPNERTLAEFLDCFVDKAIGRMSTAEYSNRAREIAERSNDDFSRTLLLDISYREYLTHRDNEPTKLLDAIQQILTSEDVHDHLRAQALAKQIFISAMALTAQLRDRYSILRAKQDLGLPLDKTHFEETEVMLTNWEGSYRETRAKIVLLSGNLFLADLIIEVLNIKIFIIFLRRMFWPEAADDLSSDCEEEISLAESTYTNQGDFEGVLRIRVIRATLFDLVGRVEEARAIAKAEMETAEILGNRSMIECTKEILEESSMGAVIRRRDSESEWAKELQIADLLSTEQGISEASEYNRQVLDLPVDRLPQLRQDVISTREDIRLRQFWCEFSGLVQDLGHTRRADTAYRDPLRFSVQCSRFGHTLLRGEESEDLKSVIDLFKEKFCKKCAQRKPKGDYI